MKLQPHAARLVAHERRWSARAALALLLALLTVAVLYGLYQVPVAHSPGHPGTHLWLIASRHLIVLMGWLIALIVGSVAALWALVCLLKCLVKWAR